MRKKRTKREVFGESLNFEFNFYRLHSYSLRKENHSDFVRLLCYFGHTIPEMPEPGYSSSLAEHTFSIYTLLEALNTLELQTNSRPFDAILLSTCYGGTPGNIEALSKYSKYIVASPVRLHLSYFYLNREEIENISKTNVYHILQDMTQREFNRLQSFVMTEIGISIYDTDITKSYLTGFMLKNRGSITSRLNTIYSQYIDCLSFPSYRDQLQCKGVSSLFRDSKFSINPCSNHSGWACRSG